MARVEFTVDRGDRDEREDDNHGAHRASSDDSRDTSAVVVGNFGPPAISAVGRLTSSTVLVAEVSSFQLALTESFHPRVSVLLNITPDHADWHGSHEAYVADKARIFANQGAGDTAIVDVDDPGSAPFAEMTAGRRYRDHPRESARSGPCPARGLFDGELCLETPGRIDPPGAP